MHGTAHGTMRTRVTQITWPRRLQAKCFGNSVFAFGESEGPRVRVGDGFHTKAASEQGQELKLGLGQGEGLLEKCMWPSLGRGGKRGAKVGRG